MKCNDCGHLNRDGAKFCAGCGTHLGQAPAVTPLAAVEPSCPHCGALCKPGGKFCPACGGAIAPAVVAPPAHSAPEAGVGVPADAEEVQPPQTAPLTAASAEASDSGQSSAPAPEARPADAWPEPAAECGPEARPAPTPTPVGPVVVRSATGTPRPTTSSHDSDTAGTEDEQPRPARARPGRIVIGAVAGLLLLAGGIGIWAYRAVTTPTTAETAIAPAQDQVVATPDAAKATSAADAPDTGAPSVADSSHIPSTETADAIPSAPAASSPRATRTLYRDACAGCHDRGDKQSPRVGRPGDWDGLLVRPRAALVRSVQEGHGGAPAAGGIDLTDEEARRLVAQVFQRVEKAASDAEAERVRRAAAEQRELDAAAARAAPRPTTVAPPKASAEGDWLTKLRADLDQCANLSFFAQIPCREKARWTYCNNRWNSVPECASGQ